MSMTHFVLRLYNMQLKEPIKSMAGQLLDDLAHFAFDVAEFYDWSYDQQMELCTELCEPFLGTIAKQLLDEESAK